MRIVPAFLIESDDGIGLHTFLDEADALAWINKLSAHAAMETRDYEGVKVERRLGATRAQMSEVRKAGKATRHVDWK